MGEAAALCDHLEEEPVVAARVRVVVGARAGHEVDVLLVGVGLGLGLGLVGFGFGFRFGFGFGFGFGFHLVLLGL